MGRIEIFIIINIVMSYILLCSLYKRISVGRFIIKTKRKKISIVYFFVLILWTYMTGGYILDYLRNKNIHVFEILQGITWIQLSIQYFLNSTSLGITKGGICSSKENFSEFIEWNKIRSYKWISSNKIQFEVLSKTNGIVNADLEMDKDSIENIDNLLKDCMDKAKDEKKKVKIIVITILIGIIMVMGYINIIKISKPYMIKKVKLSEQEAITVLKNTWKPLEKLHKENIRSKKDFGKIFEKTMSKSMTNDLYIILVDKDKSADEKIKFKEDIFIPTIYDTRVSIKKAYMKLPKYEEKNENINIEELVVEELFNPDIEELTPHSRRKSIFIKNDNGAWILNRISGLTSIGS